MAPLLPRQPLLLSGPQPLALPAPRPVLALPPPGVPVTARPAPLPLPGKSGLLSRLAGSAAGQLVTGTVGKLADAGRAAGGWFFRYRKQTCRQCDRSGCDKRCRGAGWMGKGAGRALSRLGGPVMGATPACPPS
ncbi:phage tape measure protein [Escherichia coli]|uniref:Phage tape measure protein n=1 Tax=Escherichia coli TaxID=562 RepID=A0A2X3KBJ8_ECOLX|nr:phage tape measure protein [Escherichia coli]